jgi:8-oxo-dGTP diphosphatase
VTTGSTPDKIPFVGVGCIVVRDGQFLLVRNHRGFWSTPGGHLDFGESPEDCAARETLEETGVSVTAVQFVAITNDVLVDAGKHYVTIWMRGEASDLPPTICDAAEIAEIGWFAPDALPTPLHLYFQNLLDGHCWPRSPANLPFTIGPKR